MRSDRTAWTLIGVTFVGAMRNARLGQERRERERRIADLEMQVRVVLSALWKRRRRDLSVRGRV